ncbi:hypothetical protein [Endozoicomonas ascidiicola]|uniref:hypothetical protein n=1 Tax=Endozoicomonas ascidiicola TaxID=1698521 RepID=UPI00082C6924|nr:hypothetical protein [Endozoicomonas ascidiicola]
MSFISSVTSFFYPQPIKAKGTSVPANTNSVNSDLTPAGSAPNHNCLPKQGNEPTVEKTSLACRAVSIADEGHSLLAYPESDACGDEPLTGEKASINRAFDDRDESEVVVATGQSSKCKVSFESWVAGSTDKLDKLDQVSLEPKNKPIDEAVSEGSDQYGQLKPLLESDPMLPGKEFIAHELAYNIKHGDKVKLPDSSGRLRSFRAFQVRGVNVEAGLNAFVLCPTKLPKDGSPLDVKLVFRGTKDAASAIRDMEADGAGSKTLIKGSGDISEYLDTVLMNLLKKRPDTPVNLQILGHSLGGADSQNYASHLLRQTVRQRQPEPDTNELEKMGFGVLEPRYNGLSNIRKIDVFTKNSAGVPESTPKLIKESVDDLKKVDKSQHLDFSITHMMIKDDLVQDTGECHIGAGLNAEEAKVTLFNIKAPENASYFSLHTGKYLGGKKLSIPRKVKKLTNQTRAGLEKVNKRLAKVPETILHNRSVKKAQHVVHSLAHRFYNVLPSMR